MAKPPEETPVEVVLLGYDQLQRMVTAAIKDAVRAALAEPASEQGLMTVHEVARHAGVTDSAVYQWISSGRLPALRLGGGWRITADDYITFRNDKEEGNQ